MISLIVPVHYFPDGQIENPKRKCNKQDECANSHDEQTNRLVAILPVDEDNSERTNHPDNHGLNDKSKKEIVPKLVDYFILHHRSNFRFKCQNSKQRHNCY